MDESTTLKADFQNIPKTIILWLLFTVLELGARMGSLEISFDIFSFNETLLSLLGVRYVQGSGIQDRTKRMEAVPLLETI